jgi:hypothetical protein
LVTFNAAKLAARVSSQFNGAYLAPSACGGRGLAPAAIDVQNFIRTC